ncbi:unnamed protein product [Pleuronectes platessa]|uniref:Uncharacterized protein n=1 Tax=Pleuronectes platessa TaxID=8262 RepID=A0A9N7TX24_PLEPL|nr:unnamed protein product [Pleuronectes platessa]
MRMGKTGDRTADLQLVRSLVPHSVPCKTLTPPASPRKATSIVSDTSHPAHGLFSLLPSGRSGDGEWMPHLQSFAAVGVQPSEAGHRPAPHQGMDSSPKMEKQGSEQPSRLYLSAMHINENADHPKATSSSGKLIYKISEGKEGALHSKARENSASIK